MAQLTNTHVYGTLDVDDIATVNGAIKAKGGIEANGGINVASLVNNTNDKDNSAKITLNSVIVDDKQSSANNENKLSSIQLVTKERTVPSSESSNIKKINYHDKYVEMKNNSEGLLSLNLRDYIDAHFLHRVGATILSNIHTIDDTTYKISLSVSDDVMKATADTPDHYVGGTNIDSSSQYTSKEEGSATKNATTTNVNIPLTIPAEGGEILTNKSLQHSVSINTDTQLKKLLAKDSKFRPYVLGTSANGILLRAVIIKASDFAAYPVEFYYKYNTITMLMFSDTNTGLSKKMTLSSGETLVLRLSSAKAEKDIENIIK